MKIVSFKICPFVQRVTALLEAKGVEYDIEYIDLSNKPDWFLKLSPNGQVPILITDDERVIFESDAIVEYLDEAYGEPTLSKDLVSKAQDRAWSYLASKHYLVQCGSQRSADRGTLKERVGKLSKAFDKITMRLGDDKFANGEEMGAIDIAWLPILHRASIIKRYSGFDYFQDHPALQAWQEAVLATGIPEKSVSDDFEERFTAFYLSKNTYLGKLTRKHIGKSCKGDPECEVEDMACCA